MVAYTTYVPHKAKAQMCVFHEGLLFVLVSAVSLEL